MRLGGCRMAARHATDARCVLHHRGEQGHAQHHRMAGMHAAATTRTGFAAAAIMTSAGAVRLSGVVICMVDRPFRGGMRRVVVCGRVLRAVLSGFRVAGHGLVARLALSSGLGA